MSSSLVKKEDTEEESVVVVEIFTKDGEFVRSTQIHEEQFDLITGMTVISRT